MIDVALDTNIVVSALIAPKGNEAMVLSLALQGQLALCISPAMLAEYQEVLYRPRLKLQPNETEAVLVNIRGVSRMVHPSETLEISGHGPDNRIYECADAAQADYIVTGNAKHFPKPHKNTMIVNARQLLGLLLSYPDLSPLRGRLDACLGNQSLFGLAPRRPSRHRLKSSQCTRRGACSW